MNHTELLVKVALRAQVTTTTTSDVLDALRTEIYATTKRGDIVILKGIGTFYVGARTSRQGRNPRTGAVIHISAARKFKMKASSKANDNLR